VTPTVSGAWEVHVAFAAQSAPKGVHVGLQVPELGAVSTHAVFARVQSASFVQGSSTTAGASTAASPLLPLLPLLPLVPLAPLLPLVPLLPLLPLEPPSGSELHAIARTHPPRPHARATRERIRRS